MTQLILFDIDGTLLQTNDLDDRLYTSVINEYLGATIDTEWMHYRHVTDSGIAEELFEKHQRPKNEIAIVQDRFVSLVKRSIAKDPQCCEEIPGAAAFINQLQHEPNIVIGIATGGWSESARAKLAHVGIDVAKIAFATSDDAISRTEIMQICQRRAAAMASINRFNAITYVGDGIWDVNASAALGWNFIGIGEGIDEERLRVAGAKNIYSNYEAKNISKIMQLLNAKSLESG